MAFNAESFDRIADNHGLNDLERQLAAELIATPGTRSSLSSRVSEEGLKRVQKVIEEYNTENNP